MSRKFTRREFCAWSGAAAAMLPNVMRAESHDSLRELAARSGRLFGSPLFPQDFQRPELLRLFAEQCSIITNTVYMPKVHPDRDRFEFDVAERVASFAKEHRLKMRGHALIYRLADWVEGAINPKNVEQILRKHVSTVARHFAGQMHSWDVVNEIIDPKSDRPDRLRDNAFLRVMGPEYIEVAFRAAAEADPGSLLAYNEFGIHNDAPDNEDKRHAVMSLLEKLKSKSVPIGALGIQSHLNANGSGFHSRKLRPFLKEVADMGLEIFITELDVADKNLQGSIAERDRAVAEMYEQFLEIVLEEKAVTLVLTWGLHDGDSWLQKTQPRPDGQHVRTLPFDDDLRAKPVFEAMARAFKKHG